MELAVVAVAFVLGTFFGAILTSREEKKVNRYIYLKPGDTMVLDPDGRVTLNGRKEDAA